jgi:hypothetical protein
LCIECYRGPGFLAVVLLGFFPSSLSASFLSFLVFLCATGVELTDGRGGKGVGEEPNHKTARKPGPP